MTPLSSANAATATTNTKGAAINAQVPSPKWTNRATTNSVTSSTADEVRPGSERDFLRPLSNAPNAKPNTHRGNTGYIELSPIFGDGLMGQAAAILA